MSKKIPSDKFPSQQSAFNKKPQRNPLHTASSNNGIGLMILLLTVKSGPTDYKCLKQLLRGHCLMLYENG